MSHFANQPDDGPASPRLRRELLEELRARRGEGADDEAEAPAGWADDAAAGPGFVSLLYDNFRRRNDDEASAPPSGAPAPEPRDSLAGLFRAQAQVPSLGRAS